jgi:UDP-N-acetyl-D-glucosamine dehydrogenase
MALRRRGRPRTNTSKHEKALMKSILDGSCVVGVVGLGYVGLPLALEFAKKGIRTIGVDVTAEKVKMLNAGKNYIQDLKDAEIRDVVKKTKMLSATTDFAQLSKCDVIYICVPTPFTPNKDPDITHVLDASRGVADAMRPGQLVILKSTTFPGTTEKYVKPILDATGYECGKEYFLAFSPERIDPGARCGRGRHQRQHGSGHRHQQAYHRRSCSGELAIRSGDGKASREYLPQCEHRFGE